MGCGVYLKALLGCFAIMVLVGLLFVGDGRVLESKGPTSTRHTMVFNRDDRTSVHVDLDLNMSKRRVPNGPDPIHNRGAGKSRQPPGRA